MKPISDVSRDLANNIKPDGASYAETLLVCTLAALDEWQASVEKRLAELTVPDECDTAFQAARDRIRSGAHVTDHRFKITDPGPSKYDREPVETEE